MSMNMTDLDVEPLEIAPPPGHCLKSVPQDLDAWRKLLAEAGIFTMSCECGLLLAGHSLITIAHMWQHHVRHVAALMPSTATPHHHPGIGTP